ncbi:hypothetical protein [Polyangium aurulentum]|uniref:hypothetical protein n=1 Tax=Polyangium aurulentum TaxID=2567896 RepID=UPI0010AED5EE|nr:hypothetical protein [Polyangium aurulentum]UQA55718.1 hypothetical protein E8A73_030845 [Polyangium aurulentum]
MELVRTRLARTREARLGFFAGLATAAVFAVMAAALRAGDGPSAPLEGIVELGAASIAWAAATPTALAAARNRGAHDRADGIEALAATRGIHARGLEAARAVAAMMQIARTLGIPLVGLALLTAALAGSFRGALARIGLAVWLAVFAAIAGVTLGSLATLCSRFGGRRGRLLLAVVVVVPWMLAALADSTVYSIPGALGAVLSFAFELAGGGAGA